MKLRQSLTPGGPVFGRRNTETFTISCENVCSVVPAKTLIATCLLLLPSRLGCVGPQCDQTFGCLNGNATATAAKHFIAMRHRARVLLYPVHSTVWSFLPIASLTSQQDTSEIIDHAACRRPYRRRTRLCCGLGERPKRNYF